MSVYTALFSRLPSATPAGKSKAVRDILAAAVGHQEAIATVNARDDLSVKGRAQLLAQHMKGLGATYRKGVHQAEYGARQIEKRREAMRQKAIGEARPTDAEYRTYLRSLDDGKRLQLVLKDPAARGAALREPGLSGLTEEGVSRALEFAINDVCKDEAAALAVAEEAQSIHNGTVQALTRDLLETRFIVTPAGTLRSFESPREFEAFLAKEVPATHPNMQLIWEKEADAVEAAA